MGISGLLENLKSIVRKRNATEFSGLKVAVDGHCWLHQGAYSCSKDITNGVSTAKYVQFFVSMVNVLRNSGISHILVVFDGLPLPNKSDVNQKRSDAKKQNLELARAAEIAGDHKLAMTYYQRSVSVTFEMVQNVMSALDQLGVAYMMAPYESDAQLAWLSKNKIVDIVVTEDSDTIAYGCPQVFLKMDRDGNGDLIQSADIAHNQTLSFANWTDDQFILFCCLAGCDYMPGLTNFGVKSAHKAVAKHKTLSRVVDHLTLSGALKGYTCPFAARLQQAVMTFQHQTIYNPFTEITEPLTPLPEHHSGVSVPSAAIGVDGAVTGSVQRRPAASTVQSHSAEYDFLGPLLDAGTAKQLAAGQVNPKTLPGNSRAPAPEKPDKQPGASMSFKQPASGDAGPDTSAHSLPVRTAATSHSEDIDWEFKFPQPSAADPTVNLQPAPWTEPCIRWRSAEDHQYLAYAAAGAHSGAAATSTKFNGQRSTRTRGRPKNSACTAAAVPASAAIASFAVQQYRSTLVSDDLQAMHRKARPRSLEPNYRKLRRLDGHGLDHHDPIPLRSEEFDTAVSPIANADGVVEVAGASSVYPIRTPPDKKHRFFDSPPPSTPPHHFVSDEVALSLQQDATADAYKSDTPFVDDEITYLDNVLHEAVKEESQRGLAQFQDDVFFAGTDAAHKLALLRPLSADILPCTAVPCAMSTGFPSRFDPHAVPTPCEASYISPCNVWSSDAVAAVVDEQHYMRTPRYGSLGCAIRPLPYAPTAAHWDKASTAGPGATLARSAISEVAHFLREANTYDVHRKHALFPSLAKAGANSYDLY